MAGFIIDGIFSLENHVYAVGDMMIMHCSRLMHLRQIVAHFSLQAYLMLMSFYLTSAHIFITALTSAPEQCSSTFPP